MPATCGQMRAAGAHVPPHRADHELFEETLRAPAGPVIFTAETGRRYVDVADLAAICGLCAADLDRRYRPGDFAIPRDMRWDGKRMWFAIASLYAVADALGAGGANDAAILLRAWVHEHLTESDLELSPHRPPPASSPLDRSWAHKWEKEHDV